MTCPACGHRNIEGEDTCDNCGASLWPAEDMPGRRDTLLDRLLGEHLIAVGAAPPVMIEAGSPVRDAVARMHDEGLDCVLVASGDRVVGIFTDRGAVLRAAGRPMDALDVRDLMTPEPLVLRPGDTLAVAIHTMADRGYRHIPVVGDDGPIGVITAKDVFRHVLDLADRA
jgi:CBS domain-containing protein